MNKQELIKKFLIDDIQKNTGVTVNDCNANIMSIIKPLEFLYTLINLEQNYFISLEELFKNSDYTFLTINNFSSAVAAQLKTPDNTGR